MVRPHLDLVPLLAATSKEDETFSYHKVGNAQPARETDIIMADITYGNFVCVRRDLHLPAGEHSTLARCC